MHSTRLKQVCSGAWPCTSAARKGAKQSDFRRLHGPARRRPTTQRFIRANLLGLQTGGATYQVDTTADRLVEDSLRGA